jgi:type IV pilus assembly protein PilW
MKPNTRSPARRQRGLTLIEMLVALTIGLIVAIAAVSTLIAGRSGFSTVDNTSQLVDRERFAIDTISKVVAQAGFEDVGVLPLTTRALTKAGGGDPESDLYGWNDAVYGTPSTLEFATATFSGITDGNRNGACAVNDTSCKNGSDVLTVRFQGSGSPADGTMINCRGLGEPGLVSGNIDTRAVNMFYVGRDANTGEPALFCAYYNHAGAAWVAGQALIDGVETFQVLYGVDNVTAGVAPPAAYGDFVVDQWLRGDQLKVPGNGAATRENFRRVRAIRVGMVLRGAEGSAQTRQAASLAPLGSPTFVASADNGSKLDVAADGRLRRVVNFTVHIRNDLTTR